MSLTKHPEGSFKELLTIALPLMLSSLSVMVMLFVDRLFLAQYSLEVLNASVNAATLAWTFHYGWIVMAGIAEVFVAQYNGSGEIRKIGEPVWQMVWLSIGSILMYIPLTLWGAELFFGTGPERQLERQFFQLSMMFGPSYPLYSALFGFFVGRGKTRLVTLMAIGANILNAILDWILIFGLDGILDPMGIRGAVIATNATTMFQVAIFGVIFLNKRNRDSFDTGNYSLNWTAMWQCIRIGFPGSLFIAVEILGWFAYYAMMTVAGTHYITVAGICQSVVILMWFAIEGVSKAVTTIAGNLIGAERSDVIPKVIVAGAKFHLLFFASILLVFPFVVDFLIDSFLPGVDEESLAFLRKVLNVALLLTLGHLFFEGIRFLFSGALTAAGDTIFLLVGGTSAIWVLMVFPIYIAIVIFEAPIEVGTAICLIYSMAASLIYWWRFRAGHWRTISIRAPSASEPAQI